MEEAQQPQEVPQEDVLANFKFPWWKRLVVWTIKLFWLFIAVIAVIAFSLQLPPIQTQLAHIANKKLSAAMGFEITMKAVSISWFDEAKFIGLRILDTHHEPMIEADVLKANFSLFSMIREGRDLYLDQAVLSGATVRLASRDSLNITQFIEVIDQLTASDPNDTTVSEPTDVHIDNIILDNVTFRYDDVAAPAMEDGLFDYQHIHFKNLFAVADKFRVARDTIELKLRSMKGRTPDGLMKVDKLTTDFLYTSNMMRFEKLYAKVNNSIIKDSLAFKFAQSSDFQDFNHLIRIDARLDSTQLNTKDLAMFSATLNEYPDHYIITTHLKGTVDNLIAKKLDAHFGDSSHVMGQAVFIGLPDIDNTLIDLRLKQSVLQGKDVATYAPDLKSLLSKFGRIYANADFFGMLSDFRTDGHFVTNIGKFETDLNLKTGSESYKGTFKTDSLNLGILSGMPELVQCINIDGSIKGRGLSIQNADFVLDAKIDRLGFKGYEYRNIYTDGHIKQKLFEGEFVVKDPNLQLAVNGEINFADSTFNFEAQLDTVNLLPTNLASQEGFAKAKLEAHFRGLDPSLISGTIGLSDTEVSYGGNDLSIDYLSVSSQVSPIDSLRHLIVQSNLFSLDATGQFSYQTLLSDGYKLKDELMLYFESNDSIQTAYYNSPQHLEANRDPYWFDCRIRLKQDINSAIRLFDPYVYVSSNSLLHAKVVRDSISTLSFQAKADTIFYGHYESFNDSISINLEKPIDSADFKIDAFLYSLQQDWDGLPTKNLFLQTYSMDSSLFVSNHIEHGASNDIVDLLGNFYFYKDSVLFDFGQTGFSFLNNAWASNGDCQLVAMRDFSAIKFRNIKFSHENQSFLLNGVLGKDSTDELHANIEALDLDLLSPYIGKKLEGQGFIDAYIKQAFSNLKLESDMLLNDLKLDNYWLGAVHGQSKWFPDKEQLFVDVYLDRNDFRVLKLNGYYRPNEKNERKKLNMMAILDGASMQLLEPFAKEYVSELAGTAIGLLSLKGSLAAPILRGDVLIHQGKFKVNYLNTVYTFSDHIKFREDFIGMKDLKLYDKNRNKAYINGGIYHNNFSDILLQISGKMERFMALNTNSSQSDAYYGTAISTGSFSVFGPPNNIDLSVTARTDKGTKLYIPLDGYASVEDVDFIKFVTHDTTQKKNAEPEVDASGMKMDFNIELTPDAYCEIIFDKKAGDIIRGNGRGKIKMEIDLQGSFSMFGDVEILRGAYNFTLLNVINKEFGLRPNSFIRWSGDPYGALLDITATYTQKASLAPILTSQTDSSLVNAPEMRRAYPVQVLLNLEGKLLSPNITFGVDIMDYPSVVNSISLESYVAGFEQRMRNDEQELSKQVFSLIVLKKLSPENAFSGISQSAGSSVSELLTNQLSYWVSQVDENLEIDLDLNGLNADALNTFQLRLSYTFLNGRLRVSREGGFTNLQNETDLTSVIGDWTLEYLLSTDGKLRLKMYRKQNFNTFGNSSVLGTNATNGVSLLRSKSFERLGDLFKKEKPSKKRTPPPAAPPTPSEIERPEEDDDEPVETNKSE